MSLPLTATSVDGIELTVWYRHEQPTVRVQLNDGMEGIDLDLTPDDARAIGQYLIDSAVAAEWAAAYRDSTAT